MNAWVGPTGQLRWANPLDQATVDGHGGGQIVVTRASGRGDELVFIEAAGSTPLWMTPQQAADLSEALQRVSGLETSTEGAGYLATEVRESLLRRGVSQAAVCARTGITKYRLSKILSGAVPMKHDELVAISEVSA